MWYFHLSLFSHKIPFVPPNIIISPLLHSCKNFRDNIFKVCLDSNQIQLLFILMFFLHQKCSNWHHEYQQEIIFFINIQSCEVFVVLWGQSIILINWSHAYIPMSTSHSLLSCGQINFIWVPFYYVCSNVCNVLLSFIELSGPCFAVIRRIISLSHEQWNFCLSLSTLDLFEEFL